MDLAGLLQGPAGPIPGGRPWGALPCTHPGLHLGQRREGHDVGVGHGAAHRDPVQLPRQDVAREVKACNADGEGGRCGRGRRSMDRPRGAGAWARLTPHVRVLGSRQGAIRALGPAQPHLHQLLVRAGQEPEAGGVRGHEAGREKPQISARRQHQARPRGRRPRSWSSQWGLEGLTLGRGGCERIPVGTDMPAGPPQDRLPIRPTPTHPDPAPSPERHLA